jgi:transcriptional regulator with XRE-family HTH domain
MIQSSITQEQLGEMIGTADRYVNKWECRMKYPKLASLVLWAQALGVTLKIEYPDASE